MDDTLLVSRAKAGDLDAFGQLYDRYFNRIYDFCWRILHDSEEAGDVTQDVFLKAMQNLAGLTKAASFKSWLFTIAHHSAVTRAERAGRVVPLPPAAHEEGFGAFDVPDPSRLENPELAAGDAELAALVWEAADALNPRDYALLDLHVRQGLESAEIAGVLGVSKGNAYTMVSRMKTAAADVIGSYVVARRGSRDCEELQAVLAKFSFPPYTEEVRRAVDAHIKNCETCTQARRSLIAPLEIFGGFAMVPAPLALKGDVWGEVSTQWHISGPGALGPDGKPPKGDTLPASPYGASAFGAGAAFAGVSAIGGGDGDDGGAVSPAYAGGGDEWDRSKILWFVGGVIGLLIFAFAGGALIASAFGDDDGDDGGATGRPTRTPTVLTTLTPGVAPPLTATPNLTPSVTPEPSATAPPTNTPAPVPPTDTPAPPAVATETPAPVATPTRGGNPFATPTPADDTPEPENTPTPCTGLVCVTPTNTPGSLAPP